MKIKTNWSALPYPHNWEFSAQCDEGQNIPIAAKNDDKVVKIAPNPKEIVLQGMATCTAIDVVSILQKMRQPLESLSVECDAKLTEQHPIVFSDCLMTYDIKGKDINVERVALAVSLSFTEYCGVTSMIKKSGCQITPKLIVNGREINIWDPDDLISEKLITWLKNVASKAPQGAALITGSSRGIGSALTKQLVKQGYAVIPTSRSNKTFEENEIFDNLHLDISKTNSILSLKNLLDKSGVKLNLLVHNAGLLTSVKEMKKSYTLDLSFQELRHILDTNLIGLIETNNALINFMTPNSKIVMVSSIMGHPSNEYFNFTAYRISKRAVNQYAKLVSIQCDSEKRNISIISLHPGNVQTDMNPGGDLSPEQCAKNIGKLLLENMSNTIKENSGSFWSFNEKSFEWQCLN
jgi:NAD(P)-dependent dehydrogenase (short-subunit alcohol dehydrogenase family)/uncharacterized OsmC-like protein